MIIRQAQAKDKAKIAEIRPLVFKSMLAAGLYQWDDEYPSEKILFEDIDKGHMIIAQINEEIAGYVTVNKEIPAEYSEIPLKFSPKICVHRLSVNPAFGRLGIATALMDYVHKEYKARGFFAICLDTCEDNTAALGLYEKLGYRRRGYVTFPRRPKFKFPVMERKL